MTAKEFMLQYRKLTVKIETAETTLVDIMQERDSLSINLDGMPHGTDLSDRTARLAVKLADIESEIIEMRSEAWSKRMEITRTINKMRDSTKAELLTKRYIHGMSWEEIAVDMSISFRHAIRMHGYALQEIAEILKDVL